MNRTEMVKARTAQLEKLDDIQIVNMVIDYFNQNATLPGQKRLKTFAQDLKAEFDGSVITGLLSQVRKELIEEFASLLVCEVKPKMVGVMNENRPNRGKEGTKASDLPMVLKDTYPIPVNVMKNIYEMPVVITGNCLDPDNDQSHEAILGRLPKGFMKNHPQLDGMKGTLIVTDHSNSNFANMSYRMLIDLGQSLAA